jgi:hypothetical protein
MGEVYRARDAKLNRDVAIKVLPATLANDAQYMARFGAVDQLHHQRALVDAVDGGDIGMIQRREHLRFTLVGLYQKFGYWPRYLTALMTRTPEAKPAPEAKRADASMLLSALTKSQREQAIQACGKLTHKIDKGLDLGGEIRAVIAQRTGDVVLTYTRGVLDAFAVCLNGPGSEGGEKTCYVKFGAARGGAGAGERFDKLLEACDGFAASRGATIEAGVNLAREDAYRRMRAHGYRVSMQGVAMQRPHADGFNRDDVYVIDDWR